MAKYLVNGHYVDRETYQKHLEGEHKKITTEVEKAEKALVATPKSAPKEAGK